MIRLGVGLPLVWAAHTAKDIPLISWQSKWQKPVSIFEFLIDLPIISLTKNLVSQNVPASAAPPPRDAIYSPDLRLVAGLTVSDKRGVGLCMDA